MNKKFSIFLLEDENIAAMDLQQSLERYGYSVFVVSASGENTIEKADRLRPDIVLVAIELKGNRNRIQTAQILHQRYEIPIIFLAACDDEKAIQQTQSSDAFIYLIKPFAERELVTNIELALSKHQLAIALRDEHEWLKGLVEEHPPRFVEENETFEAKVNERTAVREDLTRWTIFAKQKLLENNRLLEEKNALLSQTNERLAQELAERQKLSAIEEMISNLSTRFLNICEETIHEEIESALGHVARFLNVDRAYVFQLSLNRETISNTHEWCCSAIPPQKAFLQEVPSDYFSWGIKLLKDLNIFQMTNVEDLPESAQAERNFFTTWGIQSALSVPLVRDGVFIGFIGIESFSGKQWLEFELKLLRTVGEIFINAIYRWKSYQAIRDSEERFRAIFESSQDCILVWDQNYNYIYANQAAIDHVGTTPDQVIGKTIREGLGHHPDFMRLWMERVDQVFSTKQSLKVSDAVLLNGRLVYSESVLSPIFDARGAMYAVGVVYRDITDKKLDQVKLQESEHLYRFLVDHSPASTILIDVFGKIILCSQQAAQLHGFESVNDLIGLNAMSLVVPPERAQLRKSIDQFYQTGQSYDQELTLLKKNGTTFPASLSTSVIKDIHGRSKMILGVTHDLTEHKAAERIILRRNKQLETIREIGLKLIAELDLNKLLETIVVSAVELLGGKFGGLYLYDETREALILAMITGPHNVAIGQSLAKGEGLSGKVWQTRRPLIVNNYSQWPERARVYDEQRYTGIIAVPILSGDRFVGVINVSTDTEYVFTEEDTEILSLLGGTVAIAIRNAWLHTKATTQLKQLEALQVFTTVLRQAKSQQEMTPLLLNQAILASRAGGGEIYLLDDLSRGLSQRSSQFYRAAMVPLDDAALVDSCALDSLDLPLQPTLFFSSLESSSAQRVSGKEIYRIEKDQHSFVILPLRTAEATIGLLVLIFAATKIFTVEEETLLSSIAEMGGNALLRASIMETLEQRVVARTRELSLLLSVAALANSSNEIPPVLNHALGEITYLLPETSGWIQVFDDAGQNIVLTAYSNIPDEMVSALKSFTCPHPWFQRVIEKQEPLLIHDLGQDGTIPAYLKGQQHFSYLGVSIRVKGKTIGIVNLLRPISLSLSIEEIALVGAVADQIGIAIDRHQLRKETERAAVLEERQKLARNLHDSVTQSLYSLNLLSSAYRQNLGGAGVDEVDEWLRELGEISHQALREMRLLLYELRPGTLDQDGLDLALRRRLDSVETRAGLRVDYAYEVPSQIEPEVGRELYWIAHEALNNALKHATAEAVQVHVFQVGQSLHMVIADDGVGAESDAFEQSGGMGVTNMRARARQIGGQLEIKTAPTEGTKIHFSMRGSCG